MAKLRRLKEGECPNVGDVLEMFTGPFSTAVVTYVHDDGHIDVERPMLLITGAAPSPAIRTERINSISPESYQGAYTFWTYRDGLENVWYEEQGRKARAEEQAKALAALEATLTKAS
jgi:hypothetical protein